MDKKGIGCIVFAVVVVLLLFILLPGLAPMRWILQAFYRNPVGTSALVVGIFLLIFGWNWEYSESRSPVSLIVGLVLVVFSLFWFTLSEALTMNALYKETTYTSIEAPYAVTEFRNSSYMEAKENFKDQNPDARYDFYDLDYIRGNWISDFSPTAGITPLTQHTAGFFEYHPGEKDPVVIKRQEMPYAEGGYLWNSSNFYIYNKEPFSTFTEILYIDDPASEGEYMAVVSLIYRRGIFRVPYVGKVMLIHGNGDYEYLTPAQAEVDPRLENVQIQPEWLAQKRALAFGWKEGVFPGIFSKKGRLSIQRSEINRENSAPYHLQTTEGMMWYTPLAPMRKESLKGIAMEQSGKIGGNVYIWMLSGDQAWRGVDPLATTIKGVERGQSINWLRVSGEGGEVRSGDTDIIELLPCPRNENGSVVLYMCGYISTDPPKSTRFYTIIEVESQKVLKDLKTIEEVNQWLNGKDIPLQQNAQNGTTITSEETIICSDPQGLSDENLLKCIILYAEELENRKK